MINLYKNLFVFTFFIIILMLHCLRCKAESAYDPQLCKYGDVNCIRDVINEVIHKNEGVTNRLDLKKKTKKPIKYNEKNEYFNLSKLDPLAAMEVHLQRNSDSPVNIDILFTDNNIIGLNRSKILSVKGFGSNLTQKHSINWYNDAISLIGNYKIDGKILFLPIVSEGLSNITLVKTNYTIKFRGKAYDKDGQTYMKTDKLYVEDYPGRLIFKIDNLFNGHQQLSDSMNKLVNENWLEIYNEIRQPLLKEFTRVIQLTIDRVFAAQPYDKLFLN